MQIEQRSLGDVVVLDLKGRVTLGEGDEPLDLGNPGLMEPQGRRGADAG